MRFNRFVAAASAEDFSPMFALLQDPDGINLSVAATYKRPSEVVRQAAANYIMDGDLHYGQNSGLPALRAAISADLGSRFDVDLDPDEVLVTSGGGAAFLLALMALVEPGYEVLVPDPGFPPNFNAVTLLGATPVPYPVNEGGRGGWTCKALEPRISDRTRLVIVGNPDTPLGIVPQRAELNRLGELARHNDFSILSDEVYSDIVFDAPFTSALEVPSIRERCVMVGGFSKNFALSGFRIGYAAAPPQAIRQLARIQMNDGAGANLPGQHAAFMALKAGKSQLAEWVEEYTRSLTQVISILSCIPKLSFVAPQGGLSIFINIREYGPEEVIWNELMEQEKVATTPGSWYGPSGAGWLRICFAAEPPERMLEGLRRMAEYFVRIAVNGTSEDFKSSSFAGRGS